VFYYKEENKTASSKNKRIFKELQLSTRKQAQHHQKRRIYVGSTPTVNPFALFPGEIINNLVCPIIEKETKQQDRKTN